ncbi:MAG: glycosyltransferase [Acidobacteriota bacterium]|nr:glycosyltransferase [Acidobacteriota bacterium]
MTAAAVVLLAISLVLAAWSYLGYPAWIRARAAATPAPVPHPASSTSVAVLVSAADEERVIGARVDNLLAQDAPGPYRILIGCDGSRDATARTARAAGDERVHVIEFPFRRGKASVLNELIASTDAEILVFTDANTAFDPGAVRALCDALADPRAGAACGRLILETGDNAAATPEALFWDRETSVKEAEGRLGICLGANGAIYAARRSDAAPIPADTTSMDDFLIPLGAARRGRSIVFALEAVAREAAARTVAAEASRRFRIGIGAGQVLRRERWLWNFRRRGLLAVSFFSRKVARWLAPLLLLLAAAAALKSPSLRTAGAALLAACALALLSLPLGLPSRGPAGRLYYFAVINLALASGVAAGLVGYRRPVWKPVARS